MHLLNLCWLWGHGWMSCRTCFTIHLEAIVCQHTARLAFLIILFIYWPNFLFRKYWFWIGFDVFKMMFTIYCPNSSQLIYALIALQAQDNIMNLPLSNGWGEKHRLFVKWKYIEAKVCFDCLYILSTLGFG